MNRPDEALDAPAIAMDAQFVRLYWIMRLAIGAIWLWTAIVSWFVFPHAQSIEWLRKIGISSHAEIAFSALCVLDLLMGILSCVFATALLWWSQLLIVGVYSLVISILLPEFLLHPFGPIIKNLAVLACLAYLGMAERGRLTVREFRRLC
jgi:hypothetical protein